MLTSGRYLVDASATARLTDPEVVDVIRPLLDAGQVATCGMVELALLGRIRDPRLRVEVAATRAAALQWLHTTDADLRRALEVQRLLGEAGQYGVGWQAMVVSAVAERHGVGILHSDASLDLLAKCTGQDLQRIGPRARDAQ